MGIIIPLLLVIVVIVLLLAVGIGWGLFAVCLFAGIVGLVIYILKRKYG